MRSFEKLPVWAIFNGEEFIRAYPTRTEARNFRKGKETVEKDILVYSHLV